MTQSRMFEDRNDAAERLAVALEGWRGTDTVVVAIPRGGVPMGCRLAQLLQLELDVVLVRKIGAPGWREVAVGAIDETGHVHVAAHAAQHGAGAGWIEQEAGRQLALLQERRARYTPGDDPLSVAGRTVIVVDDGMATGETMLAALQSIRSRGPARLVCAVPVASPEALALVEGHADSIVCLSVQPQFGAVSSWYRNFEQVSDAEVVVLLRGMRAIRHALSGGGTYGWSTESGLQPHRSRSADARLASYP